MEVKKTLVLGASTKIERYSNKAVRMLREYNIPVVAVGNKNGVIEDVVIHKDFPSIQGIHTVTLYLSAKNQKIYYDQILALHPKRVLFNPGTENADFQERLIQSGITFEAACTLVLLRSNSF